MSNRIGVGIVTYKRQEYFKNCYASIDHNLIDELVVVNDGTPYNLDFSVPLIQHDVNMGVGKSKNDALKHLLDKGCDHLFLIEDDIMVQDASVFQKYIQTAKTTGIHHLNYSQHGLMNKHPGTDAPNSRIRIEYSSDVAIDLYPHCVGAFSYYSKKCLDQVGLLDDAFHNAFDHVEHTYRIIQANMHPQFWWFADVANSNKYLKDVPWSVATSTISSRPDHNNLMHAALKSFKLKHGTSPIDIPQTSIEDVTKTLRLIARSK
jgi:glycosyltransferase involved in cell wall biosynthesis